MGLSKFLFLDKQKLNEYLPDLFEILYSNMTFIAPTGNSYNEDFALWKPCIVSEMQKDERQIVLLYVDGLLAGYFRYYIDTDTATFIMEDIQINEAFRESGLFSAFYRWLIKQLPESLIYVEANANKENLKSQGILKHLGLKVIGENKNGKSFCFRGQYLDLVRKYG